MLTLRWQSQILLQERGFRLHPCYARLAIQHLLLSTTGCEVVTEDHYMDTEYCSDLDKFEVKQVVININLQAA
jgi:hypothetical protein